MKNYHVIGLLAAVPTMAFAQMVPTGDAPLGLQPASASVSVSGKVIELLENNPSEAMTTSGRTGMLMADGHGAYWWSTQRDKDGHYQWMSARQGTYTLADSDRSVVVK